MKDMSKNKKYLGRMEERELINQYQKTGDIQYIETLLREHTSYIHKIAAQQYQKFGRIVEFEDLLQEGKIGLIKAITKFKLDMQSINPNDNSVVINQRLLTYAHTKILSEMQTLFHKSNATHIPAHTIRAIHFNVKNPGCNTEERKTLAKRAMRAESLDSFFNYEHSGYFASIYTGNEPKFRDKTIDPTFEQSITQIYSPQNQKAIQMLTDIEWKIVKMRLGLVEGEDGVTAKSPFIAEELNLTVEEVEKSFKKAKRILSKNLEKIT